MLTNRSGCTLPVVGRQTAVIGNVQVVSGTNSKHNHRHPRPDHTLIWPGSYSYLGPDHTLIILLSGPDHTLIWLLSSSGLALIWLLSGSYHPLIWLLSSSYPARIWLLSGSYHPLIWPGPARTALAVRGSHSPNSFSCKGFS